jgi:hypothetical protein
LGLAAINGKFMQGIGRTPWQNLILSGLVMSLTRASLVRAIASAPDPSDVIMVATDGIYSTAPLQGLELGTKLGQWKLQMKPDLFIVQPGFYCSPRELKQTYKSRGISRSIVAEHGAEFSALWEGFIQRFKDDEAIPAQVVPKASIPHEIFIGLRLAQELKKMMRDDAPPAGSWQKLDWKQSFNWSTQRDKLGVRMGKAIRHFPIIGSVTNRSAPFDRKLHDAMSKQALMLQAMPDFQRIVE